MRACVLEKMTKTADNQQTELTSELKKKKTDHI